MAELDVGKHCEIKSCKQKGMLFINVIQQLKMSSKSKLIWFLRSLFIQIAIVTMVLTSLWCESAQQQSSAVILIIFAYNQDNHTRYFNYFYVSLQIFYHSFVAAVLECFGKILWRWIYKANLRSVLIKLCRSNKNNHKEMTEKKKVQWSFHGYLILFI